MKRKYVKNPYEALGIERKIPSFMKGKGIFVVLALDPTFN